MEELTFIALREKPKLKDTAAEWFHSKWGVSKEAYLECMESYLNNETEYGWYLCMDGNRIVGGLGVIKNDFHDRKDLCPNVCAVYTEEEYRCKGIAGHLLDMTVNDLEASLLSTWLQIIPAFMKDMAGSFFVWYRETENRRWRECISIDKSI